MDIMLLHILHNLQSFGQKNVILTHVLMAALKPFLSGRQRRKTKASFKSLYLQERTERVCYLKRSDKMPYTVFEDVILQ